METHGNWRHDLIEFFDERSRGLVAQPSIDDLCFIAGRDARVWRNEARRADLGASISDLVGADENSSVLEVGSAAGFLAMLVAPRVGSFMGVDIAEGPLEIARKLGIPNASFRQADGSRLPFEDRQFDAAFCYDVFTNFPTIEAGIPLIREMLRVVSPTGRVLVGNIPDRSMSAELPNRVKEISQELEREFGPPYQPVFEPGPKLEESWMRRWLSKIMSAADRTDEIGAKGSIVTYDFDQNDFVRTAVELKASVEICPVHKMNPYFGYRFNAVFTHKTP